MAVNDMNAEETGLSRYKQPAMAVGAGAAAALVVATLPHVYLENVIGATGLSEILPAAAPPLGNTARGLVAIAAGLTTAAAVYLFIFRKRSTTMGVALRDQINAASPIEEMPLGDEKKGKRFNLPKFSFNAKSLTKFLKKPQKSSGRVMDLKDLPQLRDADRHPDAPARRPIFADSDLGTPLAEEIKPFDASAFHAEQEAPFGVTPTLAEATIGEAPVVESADEFAEPVIETSMSAPAMEAPAPAVEEPAVTEDLSQLSIAQLTDRLEAGLKKLRALQNVPAAPAAKTEAKEIPVPGPSFADGPTPVSRNSAPKLKSVETVAPVQPVEPAPQENAEPDMDAALKAALGTLEKMTAQR